MANAPRLYLRRVTRNMNIAVASGKGGTGKTTVATNLAYVASHNGRDVAILDCDVEEPNAGVFLGPEPADCTAICTSFPRVDEDRCTLCGECGGFCRYSAIACLGKKVLVFPELCHACGGCSLICPERAITEASREIGHLEVGRAGAIRFVQGTLNIGEAKSPPVIRAVKAAAPKADLIIRDVPAGTSCPVVESVRDCDLVLLVTEPTPFGLNDLRLAVEMVCALGLPFGVVINRADIGDRRVRQYCESEGIEVLAEIPNDRAVAEAYSRGELISEVSPVYAASFTNLLEAVATVHTVQTRD
jgi:MinD superfamily P-loop ATPase